MINIAICDDDTFFIDYIEKVIVEVNGSDKDINFYEYTKGKVISVGCGRWNGYRLADFGY